MVNRLLTAEDRPLIENLCKERPEYNIFLFSSLDCLNVEQDLVQYWGQFNMNNDLVGILMRYGALRYMNETTETDINAFAEIIESKKQPKIVINDNSVKKTSIVSLLRNYSIKMDLQGQLLRANFESFNNEKKPENCTIRKAVLTDIDRLVDFYAKAPEDVYRGADSIRRSIIGERRTFILEIDNEIIACALTTAEIPGLAMIGGLHVVSCANSHEYLRAVLCELVKSLLSDGNNSCVVTRVPFIESVCRQIGFEGIGPWRMTHMVAK